MRTNKGYAEGVLNKLHLENCVSKHQQRNIAYLKERFKNEEQKPINAITPAKQVQDRTQKHAPDGNIGSSLGALTLQLY